MTAEYELTKDDLMAFNLYHHFHSPTARRHYYGSWYWPAFVWLFICTSLWYLAAKQSGTPLKTFFALLPLFSGVPIYLAIFPWWYRRKLRKIVAGMVGEGRNRSLFSHRRVTLSPESITDSGEFVQSSTDWRAVERVARNGNHLFVYTNSLVAIIVPQRAFAAPTDFENFVQTANDYHKKAAP